jgi:hypothetical protein
MLKDTKKYIGDVVSIKIEIYICINFLKYFICIFELGVIGNMVGRTLGDIAKAPKNFF